MKTRMLIVLCSLLPAVILAGATPKVGTDAERQPWKTGVPLYYDGAGNLRAAGADRYVYDAAGRLVAADTNGIRQSYTYDAYGNRRSCTNVGDCQYGYVPDPATNRMAALQYDSSGRVVGLGQTAYAYDALDMQTVNTSAREEFIYTADDERIAVYSAPVAAWRWSVRDLDGRVVRDFTSSGTAGTAAWAWSADYVYRGSMLLAARHAQPNGAAPLVRHYHLDHLGTPRRITDGQDQIVGIHDYYAFGQEASGGQDEAPLARLKFTGHERDLRGTPGLDTLDYMHARYYSAALGRFLSIDPVLDVKRSLPQPQRWNRYSYVLNNPVGNVDPDGREVVGLHGGLLGTPSATMPLARFLGRLYRTGVAVPKVNYTGLTSSNPSAGVNLASSFRHTAGTPRVLVGHSTGGDAAAIAGGKQGPAGGGKWDAVVVVTAQVDTIMKNIEGLAKNASEVVIANIPGDHFGGDRSYEGLVNAIVEKYGSMEEFRKQHPNVSIQSTGDQVHGGAAERKQTHEAVLRGLREAR